MSKNICRLLLLIFLIPIIVFAIPNQVILGGETIGIEVYSDGIYVVGFYNVNNKKIAEEAGFKVGDIIKEIDNIKVKNVEDVNNIIKIDKTYNFKIQRNNELKTINYKLKEINNSIKTGLYVKNKISGIGTLSYINPETSTFASLGHEILESNSMSKFMLESGNIYKAEVNNIKKSETRNPGEKRADINYNEEIGIINKNEIDGIYGKYSGKIDNNNIIDVGKKEDIKLGEASIKTVIDGQKKEEFNINIIFIDKNDSVKNILFEITDKNLLNKTNGIIQGMSGSPIIQNNKIIGVVNYVILDNPKQGYGIFVENMLKEEEKTK